MKKIVKEPLIQFLFFGALLFLVYGLFNQEEDQNEIVVDSNVINELVVKWESKRKRKPSIQELKGMVKEYLEQEVWYREAIALGLNENDEIIKRRLAKKMEFISDEYAQSLQPSEQDLKDYYEKHLIDYPKSAIFSLTQVFFDPRKHKNAKLEAESALTQNNPKELGDALSLPSELENVDLTKLAIDFGKQFAFTVDTLPTNEWVGPIKSGFGYHLVFISTKKSSANYSFEEVKDRVNVDYNYHATTAFKKEFLYDLQKKYKVVYDIEDEELKKALNENL